MMRDNRVRSAVFVAIVDGDTFTSIINLLPGVDPEPLIRADIRVNNWSAAELREPEGPIMRDRFEALLRAAKRIDLEVKGGTPPSKIMSFNRILASVWLDDKLFAGILHTELRRLRRGREHGRLPE